MDDYFSTGEAGFSENEQEPAFDPDRYRKIADILKRNDIPFEEDEVPLFGDMFSVMSELAGGHLTEEDAAEVFLPMIEVMEDSGFVSARDKMRGMYSVLEQHPASAGKMDNKEMLFVSFCAYLAYSVISEKDDKKHRYMGLPEFVSSDYIKYRMEEYWAMDSFMFTFAL